MKKEDILYALFLLHLSSFSIKYIKVIKPLILRKAKNTAIGREKQLEIKMKMNFGANVAGK